MKRQSYYLVGMLAMALVACNKEQNAALEQSEAEQIPVSFGAYVNRSSTKAGVMDADLDLADIQYNHEADHKGSVGFGVFAYYTNADNYDQTFTPNFMYNQKMLYVNSSTGWQYTPVKYWPNEFGSGAYSDDSDKVSFFAYAPWVSVNPASGKVNGKGYTDPTVHDGDNGDTTYGIVGMKRNNAAGDPMIQYIATAYTDRQVDLLWGVASSTTWALKNETTQTGLVEGKPFLNLQHPNTTSTSWTAAQKVTFDFKHALAKLFVTVDTKTNGTALADPAADTKVFIRSVTFEGFDTKGALNLNNYNIEPAGKALWYNFDCNNELNNGAEFTIYDGRKDGKEGLTASSKEYNAINLQFVQDRVWDAAGATSGVTDEPTNLFGKYVNNAVNTAAPILVIPNGDKLKVTIEYDVLTKDPRLATMLNDGVTPGSVVKNVITRYITKGDSAQGSVSAPNDANAIILENGKVYNIALHLGLNSVEFDAAVSLWVDAGSGGADLPHNN